MLKRMILLLAVVLASGCGNGGNEASGGRPQDSGESMGFGLWGDGALDDYQLIHAVPSDRYTLNMTILNDYSEPHAYRVLFFVDYTAVPIRHNGQVVSQIDVTVPARDRIENRKVVLFDLPSGKHQVLAILIKEPDSGLENGAFVPSPEVYMSRKLEVRVGSSAEAPTSVPQNVPTIAVANRAFAPFVTAERPSEERAVRRALTLLPSSGELWLNAYAEAGQSYLALAVTPTGDMLFERHYRADKTGMASLPLEWKHPPQGSHPLIVVVKAPFDSPSILDVSIVNRLQVGS
ncbi:hypothetical protein [Cohnella panacarvi]|uniref:hypothetical protein n=1 Tax=Cohnella panacarvi TaxID=400776 RepID=UPI0004793D84|nr:hypothetical protein [Cohnella panacarvi]